MNRPIKVAQRATSHAPVAGQIIRAVGHSRRAHGSATFSDNLHALEKRAKLESLIASATDFFGSEESARRWLSRRLDELGKTAPLEKVSLETLRDLEQALGRMTYSIPV
jgi:uncharacterized protein (DUF2384 family)